jgi:hypothetical protein
VEENRFGKGISFCSVRLLSDGGRQSFNRKLENTGKRKGRDSGRGIISLKLIRTLKKLVQLVLNVEK